MSKNSFLRKAAKGVANSIVEYAKDNALKNADKMSKDFLRNKVIPKVENWQENRATNNRLKDTAEIQKQFSIHDADDLTLHTVVAHERPIGMVKLHPTKDFVLTSSFDGRIKIWSIRTGKLLHTLTSDEKLFGFDISRSSNLVVATSLSSPKIYYWDLSTRETPVNSFNIPELASKVCFLGDEQMRFVYVYSTKYASNVHLWNVKEQQDEFKLQMSRVWGTHGSVSLTYQHQTGLLAVGDLNATIDIWDMHSRKSVHSLKGHVKGVRALASNANGNILFSGSEDTTIGVWNTQTGTEVTVLVGHEATIMGLAMSPDGKILASASSDKTVRLWNLEENICTVLQHNVTLSSVTFSRDGRTIIACGDSGELFFWKYSNA